MRVGIGSGRMSAPRLHRRTQIEEEDAAALKLGPGELVGLVEAQL